LANLLIKNIKYAVENIPYYSDLRYLSSEINEDTIFETLKIFPVIDREVLLNNIDSFVPNRGPQKYSWTVGQTSGTTGAPLKVFRDYNSVLFENAFIRRHWGLSGFKPRCKRATLRGDSVVPIERSKPPFWYFNFFDNQLVFSSKHVGEKFMPWIVEKLEAFGPTILESYPSTAYELAKYLERKNTHLDIPFVFTGSEILYEHQRKLIESCLSARVMDSYGMGERVAFAGECLHGGLHLNTDYSFVEILDENDDQTDGLGYITGTTYHNKAMPLLRYKMSDIAQVNFEPCSCGCSFPLIENIQGKFEDTIFGKSGNPISPSVLTFVLKGLSDIRKTQIAQVGDGKWEVRIVPDADYSAAVGDALRENIRTMVDAEVSVNLRIVEDIPTTEAGKFRWLVNEWERD
jgi:phenylacetate-CoA ligase